MTAGVAYDISIIRPLVITIDRFEDISAIRAKAHPYRRADIDLLIIAAFRAGDVPFVPDGAGQGCPRALRMSVSNGASSETASL